MTEYNKVTDSTVSNPDNLICDYCVNKNMYDNKLRDLENEKKNG